MLAQKQRLHISPLTSKILPLILRPPLVELACDVSLHEVLTFPENSYGFVTLPVHEAAQLRQKFHGSVLRGRKMQVREARTKKDSKHENVKDQGESGEVAPRSRRSKTTVDAGRGAVPGIELEEGRKVKRGWTEAEDSTRKEEKATDAKSKSIKAGEKGKKSRRTASITGREECLFKTKVPSNLRDSVQAPSSETKGKERKRKRGQSNGELVVHEFTNTEKHAAFLRDNSSDAGAKSTTEYIDDKGWIDKDGKVVEVGPVKRSRRARQSTGNAELPKTPQIEAAEEDEDATSSSGISSSEDEETEVVKNLPADENDAKNEVSKGLGISSTVERLSITRSSATPPPLSSDEPIPTLKSPEPHPLETLFKRPSKAASQTPKEKPMLEVSTTFSFSDPDTHGVESRLNIPQTPFTQQDIRQRRERSAAPTPDTAAPGKTFGNVWGGPDGSDIASESEENAGEDEAKMPEDVVREASKEGEQTEFAAWFYEHRGENNRAWKSRRREAAKEKRQADSRTRRGE